jgi:resuscitation-promoting factor RpfB
VCSWEAEPIAENGRRRGRPHHRRGLRRSSAHDAVAPSPARAEPHDATTWLPLPAPDSLPSVDELLTPPDVDLPAPAAAPVDPHDEPVPEAPSGPGRAEAPGATTWLPVPEVDDLPPIHDLLEPGTGSPPRDIPAQPSPARAEPHDATAWLPLPASEELPELPELAAPTPPTKRLRRHLRPHLPSRHAAGRLALFALGALTIVALFSGGSMLLDKGDDVTVRVDGTSKDVETGVSTVRSFLQEQDVKIGDHDRVTPALNAPIENDMIVSVVRAFPVPVDFDGEPRTMYSTHREPDEFVAEAAEQLGMRPAALALRTVPKEIAEGSDELQLRTKREGTLLVDGSAINYDSPSYTVAELLDDTKVVLQPNDFPTIDDAPIALDAELPPSTGDQSTSVAVVRVAGTTRSFDEPYSLDPQRLPDPELPVGETRIQQAADGIMKRTYALELHDELEAGRTLISEVPLKEAVPYVEFFGTKYNPLWDKMARCETGGNWSASGQEYQGGLGIYWKNWNHYGGRDFAPTAGQATKFEQVIVAEKIREDHGWHAWGCADRIGL